MKINAELLKSRLRGQITNRALYPAGGLTLRVVMDKAAEIAGAVVDDLAGVGAAQVAVDPKPPGGGRRRRPGQGHPENARTRAAAEKRRRLLEALADGPLHYGEIQHQAQLTGGECTYLLRSTSGIVCVGPGRYALQSG